MSRSKTPLVSCYCGTCGKSIEVRACTLTNSKSGFVFCSQSCSAKKTNALFKKRKKTLYLCSCGKVRSRRRLSCIDCFNASLDYTLQEAIYTKHHRSSAFALVRARARTVIRHIKVCQKCGYSKHVEVCHIKAISSFPLDTKISIINSPDNLLALCPNCHWELDHGL